LVPTPTHGVHQVLRQNKKLKTKYKKFKFISIAKALGVSIDELFKK